MKEKLILQLLADRRISVDETLALLGHEAESKLVRQPKPIQRRRAHRVQFFTVEQHQQIIEAFIEANGVYQHAAKKLGLSSTTVRQHAQYAGLLPLTAKDDVTRTKVWRQRRGLYLNLPCVLQPTQLPLGGTK